MNHKPVIQKIYNYLILPDASRMSRVNKMYNRIFKLEMINIMLREKYIDYEKIHDNCDLETIKILCQQKWFDKVQLLKVPRFRNNELSLFLDRKYILYEELPLFPDRINHTVYLEAIKRRNYKAAETYKDRKILDYATKKKVCKNMLPIIKVINCDFNLSRKEKEIVIAFGIYYNEIIYLSKSPRKIFNYLFQITPENTVDYCADFKKWWELYDFCHRRKYFRAWMLRIPLLWAEKIAFLWNLRGDLHFQIALQETPYVQLYLKYYNYDSHKASREVAWHFFDQKDYKRASKIAHYNNYGDVIMALRRI